MTIKDKYALNFYKKPLFINNGKSISYIDETLILSGTGPDDYRAFGGMAIDANGILHLTYRAGSDHLQTKDGTIYYQRSLNTLGTEWTERRAIISDLPGATVTVGGNGIYVTQTGRILLFYSHPITPYAMRQIHSDDGGETWSESVEMTTDYPIPTGVLGGPGRPVYKNSRYLKSFYGYPSVGAYGSYLYQSTTTESPWTQVSVIASPSIVINGTNATFEEPTLVIRHDKLLLSFLRSDPLQGTYMSYSPDDGIIWSYPTYIFAGVGMPCVDISPSGTIFIMSREAGSMRPIKAISYDGGKTFDVSYIDDRTGAQMYGGVCWSPIEKKFVVFYMVTVGDVNYGSCDVVIRRFSES